MVKRMTTTEMKIRMTMTETIVKIYCATVEVSSATAPCGQYSNYDSILSVCSGDHDSGVASDAGWATTHSKSGNGKVKGTLNLWKNKEPVKKVIFDGID